jgi:hypothetical protein
MRAQKMREEAAEKERDKHFNDIRPVIPTKQEWRVKKKANTPAPMASDDDESLLIKDESPPPIGMDMNMVFTLLAKFWSAEEEVAQKCLAPKRSCSRSPKSQAST